jgi:hypothetical protein
MCFSNDQFDRAQCMHAPLGHELMRIRPIDLSAAEFGRRKQYRRRKSTGKKFGHRRRIFFADFGGKSACGFLVQLAQVFISIMGS